MAICLGADLMIVIKDVFEANPSMLRKSMHAALSFRLLLVIWRFIERPRTPISLDSLGVPNLYNVSRLISL